MVALLSASPINWTGVYSQRTPPQREVWPYVMVYSEAESGTQEIIGLPGIYLRELTIVTVGKSQIIQDYHDKIENTLDTIAAEIETKLTTATLQASSGMANIKSLALIDTMIDTVIDDSGPRYGYIVLTWRIQYMTAEGIPATLT